MNIDNKQELNSLHRCLSVPDRWLTILLFLMSLPSAAIAQSKWTLTSADFQSRQIDLTAIDQAGVHAAAAGDRPAEVKAWADVLSLDRAIEFSAAGKYVVWLTDGDHLRGEPGKIEGEAFVFNASSIGMMSIPLRQIAAITRTTQTAPRERQSDDVVVLANGDTLHGIVSAFADKQLTVQVNGTATPVPFESVSAIYFASMAPAAATKPARAFRVRLADDSVMTAASVKTDDDQLDITLADASTRDIPFASVAAIEQINGPVSWLSSLPPAENIQTPLLQTSRPARMDRSVTGKPIRFGERTYTRGIGVAPYSRITWPINPALGYQAFRTQYAIDGAAPYADVTVRILLDGKAVHESKSFTAGQLSPVIVIPLGSAKTLSLEGDFGANYNVQAHLDWIEPALVKSTPTTPSTRP